jgi:acetyltransferase-like isoleucine patch superfamily enzyme
MNSKQYNYSLLKRIGKNVFISENVEIRRPQLITIGSNVAIDTGFYCTSGLEIGDYIHIAPYTTCIGGANGLLKMGNFTTIAAGCRIITASDEHLGAGLIGPTIPDKYRDNLIIKNVVLEDFSSIGTNVVISPGVIIAQGSVVGANSFVNKNTEPWTIYVGNPARPIKIREKKNMVNYSIELGYNIEIK